MTQAVRYSVSFKGLPDAGGAEEDEECERILHEIGLAINQLPYLQEYSLEDFEDEE